MNWNPKSVYYSLSKRGKPVLVCEGKQYLLNKKNPLNSTNYWVCLYKNRKARPCHGTLAINSDKWVVSAKKHTCPEIVHDS